MARQAQAGVVAVALCGFAKGTAHAADGSAVQGNFYSVLRGRSILCVCLQVNYYKRVRVIQHVHGAKFLGLRKALRIGVLINL